MISPVRGNGTGMAKRPVLLSVLLLGLALLGASHLAAEQSESTGLVPAGHWAYDALMYLSLETGQTTLGVFAPAPKNELRSCLDAISPDRLGPEGTALYRRLLGFLSLPGISGPGEKPLLQSGTAVLDVRPEASLFARYRQDADALFDFDLIDEFNDSPPALSLPVSFGFGPYASAFAGFDVQQNFWASTDEGPGTNLPLSADSFDMTVPAGTNVSIGASSFNIAIGRGALETGRSATGSMILSGGADRLSYGLASFFSPAFRLSLSALELAPDRFVYFHDISLRPFPFMSITLSEAASVHASLDPRFLNPAMIYHSYAGWKDDYGTSGSPVGTQFGVLADVVPFRGTRLYGQFVMNQFQTAYEQSNFTNAAVIPNSLGGMAGAEYMRGLAGGILAVTLEGVYTNPWLYIMENHDISYYWTRRDLVAPSGYTKEWISGWLGSPFGPDAIAADLRIRYDRPGSFTLGLEYRAVCRGENGTAFFRNLLNADGGAEFYPATVAEATQTTPTGRASYQHRLAASGAWFCGRLSASGEASFSLMLGSVRAISVDLTCGLAWAVR